MKNLTLLFLLIVFACSQTQNSNSESEAETSLKPEEQENEWIVLFDGSNLDQWHVYDNYAETSENWSIEDGGILKLTPTIKPSRNLVTNEEFTNFILSLEWKISEGGNSGIMWAVEEDTALNEPYYTGPEIQVLDNERHPDAKANPKYHQAGALYDLIQPSADVCKPAGEWNKCIITIDHLNNNASVELNATTIVEFEPHGQKWDSLVAGSKFADWEKFAKMKSGKIALQDHGDIVFFRDIQIKKLPE